MGLNFSELRNGQLVTHYLTGRTWIVTDVDRDRRVATAIQVCTITTPSEWKADNMSRDILLDVWVRRSRSQLVVEKAAKAARAVLRYLLRTNGDLPENDRSMASEAILGVDKAIDSPVRSDEGGSGE